MNNFATMIKELRLAKAWSQEQLAQISGISVRTIQRIENGASPSLDSQKALASAFDLSVADFQTSADTTQPEENKVATETATRDLDMDYSTSENKQLHLSRTKRLAIKYAGLALLMVVINLLTSSHYLWFLWVWLGLALHLGAFWFKLSDEFDLDGKYQGKKRDE